MTEMIKEFLLLDQDYKFKWRDLFAVLGGIAFLYGMALFLFVLDVIIHG